LNPTNIFVAWFRVAVTAFVTSTMLSYIEPGYYWDWWRPLVDLPSRYLSRPTQPCYPSVGMCSEHRRWFRPLLGKKPQVLCSVSPVTRTADILKSFKAYTYGCLSLRMEQLPVLKSSIITVNIQSCRMMTVQYYKKV